MPYVARWRVSFFHGFNGTPIQAMLGRSSSVHVFTVMRSPGYNLTPMLAIVILFFALRQIQVGPSAPRSGTTKAVAGSRAVYSQACHLVLPFLHGITSHPAWKTPAIVDQHAVVKAAYLLYKEGGGELNKAQFSGKNS